MLAALGALVTYGALTLAAVCLAARLLPSAPALTRAAAAGLLTPVLSIAVVSILSVPGWIGQPGWWAVTLILGGATPVAVGPVARARAVGDLSALRRGLSELRGDRWALLAIGVGMLATGLAIAAAALLEPFGWDALGYHLPIVHDALTAGTIRDVPGSVAYVNTYPRLVDVSFIGWRLAIGSEHLIELGQLPFVPGGVLAIAALAARGGVPPARAVGLSCLWLAVPVTMLQLPSAYIDVAVAALALATFLFATERLDRGTLLLAAIAAGVLLGSKPSAPPIVAVALLTLLVRGHRAGQLGPAVLAAAAALAIGTPKYIENLIELGNPIWPVELRLGPLVFPGEVSMAELTTIGLFEPYLSMSWPTRVLASWFAVPPFYIYDMRIGGLGPLFSFVLLPIALTAPLWLRTARSQTSPSETSRPVTTERARAALLPIALVSLASLATPGGFWARYTLAMPGALLALAMILAELRPRARAPVTAALVLAALVGVGLSWHGLSGGGPSVLELASMPRDERLRRAALDEQELDWDRARESVPPGDAFGYDASFGMPGRLARRDGLSHVAYYGEEVPSFESLSRWAEAERVRIVVLRDGGAAEIARAHPERFRERFRSRYPSWQPCSVFDVIP